MKIKNISFSNGIYTIEYENMDKICHVIGECKLESISDRDCDMSGFDNFLQSHNLVSENIKETFWPSSDEYLIIYPKFYQSLPDDEMFTVAICRYYMFSHLLDEFLLYFSILECDDENFDCDEFSYQLFRYFHWEI